jgi:adenylate cyclase
MSVSSRIFVIARNSTFSYKGKHVKVQQVAEDLGVQYVLEGSIQRSGDRLRVTAQLIDALTGHHLWSDVYDREMKQLFDLQDEITKKIVVSLQVTLTSGEDTRVYARSTNSLESWKHYVKAAELFDKITKEDNIKAREHLEAAIKLDPEFVSALAFLSTIHLLNASLGFSDSPFISLKLANELAQKAIKKDEQNPFTLSLLGGIYLNQRQHEKAIATGKRAISLNPNYAGGYGALAKTMHFSGKFEESVTLMKKAFRLDPKITPTFLIYLCKSYIFMERYEEALETCNRMDELARGGSLAGWIPPLLFANVYQELGKEEAARASVREALKFKPDLSLEFFKMADPYRDPTHLQRVLDAYRRAGLPEKASRPVT